MNTTALTGTTLNPSVLCLGTADFGANISRWDALNLLDAFADAGGTFIDTAEIYSDWVPGEKSRSEKLIGEWLNQRGNRARLVLATKGAHPRLESMHVGRMTRADIEHDLNASLANLRTDVIDLYWLHRDDVVTPVEEIVHTLNAQVQLGKIRYFGCSNWSTERIRAANAYAQTHSLLGFAANQPFWNLARVTKNHMSDPTVAVMDAAMYSYHYESDLACVPWSSQANGFFQRAFAGTTQQMNAVHRRTYADPENGLRAERVQRLARATGFSVTEVVLAYLLSQPFPVFPILGCRTLSQLQDSVRAHDKRLTQVQLSAITGGALI
jgi:aryl-alcohol dehydrogenase-like predicted oxidoreductase